ncbi:hypothetical protein OESDEN_02881 [Oesophagostomum dentatum]|uniref:Peptidase aspartic putative domain-containing protein n=1 Tax=Oesophagostomum dentatum TaxID=61180 RepID=A0A0B1TIV4_OESDE|nr:hypothetical protein OESDEN_02881 [Oesophagostomum dentatum]
MAKSLKSNEFQEVDILLDTCADKSFISTDLAEDLGLDSTITGELNMYTFGERKTKQTKCELTKLEVRDGSGGIHELTLCKADVLTSKNTEIKLDVADIDFIAKYHIPISAKSSESQSSPQILQVEYLDVPQPRYILPSGLFLIPSIFGYLLKGKTGGSKYDKTNKSSQNVFESSDEFSQ